MELEDIRQSLSTFFSRMINDEGLYTVPDEISEDAHGHEVGRPIEDWLVQSLNREGIATQSYLCNEFVQDVFVNKGLNSQRSIVNFLPQAWWASNNNRASLLVTKKSIKTFLEDNRVPRWQQAGADIALFYGDNFENFNDVLLLNVKGHNSDRASRDPNIMSGLRLLHFSRYLLNLPREQFDKVNLWFIGTNYSIRDRHASINEIHIKDLFKLDLNRLPILNFDAAIQLQWHVHNMVEIEQTKIEFITSLKEIFQVEWNRHIERKSVAFTGLITDINELLEKRIQ